MEATMMTVTPEQAKKWLKHTNTMNRKISNNTVDSYARDMKKGAWKSGYDPIVINSDGQLENGQHRLMAVVRSQIPTMFYVITGAQGAMETYDRGRPRTIKDSLIIRLNQEGKETSHINAKSAIARYILREGLGIQKPSDDVLYHFINDYDDYLGSAVQLVGARNRVLRKAAVHTAVFCALQSGVPDSVLYEFFSVATTGFMNDTWQTSAVVYRNMIGEVAFNNNYTKKWAETLTEMAIRDFVKQNPRKQKYSVDFKHSTYFKTFCEKIKKERNYL